MRVLITSPTYPPFNSGLGNAVAQQAACLSQVGYEVVVATGGGQRGTKIAQGIRVETFALTGADSWIHPIRGEVATYIDFLCNNDWDVVLLNAWQNWATDLALRHLAEVPGRKFLYSHCISTNLFFSQQPARSLVRFIAWRPYWNRLKSTVRNLDGVIFLAAGGCDSRFDDFRLAVKLDLTRHVIPNSLSPAAVLTLDENSLPFSKRDKLISVGSYNWQKGFDFVLRAYAASKAFNKIPMHFFGQESTKFSNRLNQLAINLGIYSSFVFFHEGVSGESLMASYGQAQLVLSGSHTECQPLSLLDASACATPFIARATGCIDGMPGGLAVSSWREMSKQINNLLDNTDIWQSYSRSARESAETLYHPNLLTEKLVAIFGGSRGFGTST